MNNIVNDLHHEIRFENRVINRKNFFVKQNISFLFLNNILKCVKYRTYFFIPGKFCFFKISKNSIASAFFLPEADTKKYRYISAIAD